jgi:predicted methyltransferase
MKIYEVKLLINEYGEDLTLAELLKIVQGNNKFQCPKCEGKGYNITTYNAYPEGLPDSGWVYNEGRKEVTCDVCNGIGYTKKQLKPKMVQVGWQ